MERLRQIEAAMIRWETRVIVGLVLVMLTLAGYNVMYRNVLVPLQKHWATSGPPASTPPTPESRFGSEVERPGDDAGGFGGGFEGGDGAGGFGGGFGDDPGSAATVAAADKATPRTEPPKNAFPVSVAPANPEGGPPPEGSLAAWGVALIDGVKLDWIDIFLRQLVVLVSFLGAMLATQRRKHINIDAVSRLLPATGRRAVAVAVNLLSLGVCMMLGAAGMDLVELGHRYPKELVPWASEWMFQTMFPLGFGLLSVHFAFRVGEAARAFLRQEDLT